MQAAYEQLLAARGRPRGRSGSAPTTPRPPAWQADPSRAGATREQTRRRSAPGATPGPDAGAGAGRASAPGPDGPAAGSRRTGAGSRTGPRSRKKATPGSTTYDEAHDSADPAWNGATWYGASSGEYWTINPREYADPRKHGPEYQARARRPVASSGMDTSEALAAAEAAERQRPRPEPATERPVAPPAAEPRSAPAAPAREPVEPLPGPLSWLDAALDSGRLAALAAWPPVGIAVAIAVNDATGCARVDASCTVGAVLPWLIQVVVVGILVALPALSRRLVSGTVAVALAVVPLAAVYLVLGAGGGPLAGPVAPSLLGLAWVAGVLGSLRRAQPPPVS